MEHAPTQPESVRDTVVKEFDAFKAGVRGHFNHCGTLVGAHKDEVISAADGIDITSFISEYETSYRQNSGLSHNERRWAIRNALKMQLLVELEKRHPEGLPPELQGFGVEDFDAKGLYDTERGGELYRIGLAEYKDFEQTLSSLIRNAGALPEGIREWVSQRAKLSEDAIEDVIDHVATQSRRFNSADADQLKGQFWENFGRWIKIPHFPSEETRGAKEFEGYSDKELEDMSHKFHRALHPFLYRDSNYFGENAHSFIRENYNGDGTEKS